MLRDSLTTENLYWLVREVASDFMPSLSLLLAVLAVGAWLLGVHTEVGHVSGSDLFDQV